MIGIARGVMGKRRMGGGTDELGAVVGVEIYVGQIGGAIVRNIVAVDLMTLLEYPARDRLNRNRSRMEIGGIVVLKLEAAPEGMVELADSRNAGRVDRAQDSGRGGGNGRVFDTDNLAGHRIPDVGRIGGRIGSVLQEVIRQSLAGKAGRNAIEERGGEL